MKHVLSSMSISGAFSVHRGGGASGLSSRAFSRVEREIEGKRLFGPNSGSISPAMGSWREPDPWIPDKDGEQSKSPLGTNETLSSASSKDFGTSEDAMGYGWRGLESNPLGSNDSDMGVIQ